MRARPSYPTALALLLVLTAAACGGDGDGLVAGRGLGSITGALAALPDDGEPQTIVWGDIARAGEIAGLDQPNDPGDADTVRDYMSSLLGTRTDGGPIVAVRPPDAAHVERFGELPAFVDDVGWSLLQVDQYVERQSPPDSVTVLAGDFDEGAITDALGDPSDGTWVAGSGNPGEVDVAGVTPARPLGESLWLSLSGGDHRLAITRSPESDDAVAAALDGHPSGDVLADDPTLAALAAALDGQSAYAALLARPGIEARDGRPASPEEAEAPCDEALPATTSGVATGVTDDDGPVVLVALAHPSPDAASANAAALEDMVTSGASGVNDEPWRELVELDGVETTDHDVVVARLRPLQPSDVRLWADLVVQQDTLVASC